MPNRVAPEGQMFVCAACGKRSRDQYGYQAIDSGYDESCMLSSVLVYEQKNIIAPDRPWKYTAVEGGE